MSIAPDGFIWQEKTYSSLSAIARIITGTNWNGPRFFGLREGRGGKDVQPRENAAMKWPSRVSAVIKEFGPEIGPAIVETRPGKLPISLEKMAVSGL